MDVLRISLLLLLPCFSCSLDGEVTLVKTIRKEADFTPICTNKTSNIIILIVCKIRTKKSSREECRLFYREDGKFTNECDSRFTLKTMNQTVFLQLTSLTPADSGNYSCQCSNLEGTYILHLSITVKDSFSDDNPADEFWSYSPGVTLPSALIAAVLLIIIILIVGGFICRKHPESACLRSETSGSAVHGSAAISDEDTSDELYKSLQQPTSDLYQTVSSGHYEHETQTKSANNKGNVNLENMQVHSNHETYENLSIKRKTSWIQFDKH